MSTDVILDAIPVAQPPPSRFDTAARLLEQAWHASEDPQVAYLLAMACKRQGHLADARAALQKIPQPDANVFLQLGLLSLRDQQPAQASREFARAWQMDPASYDAGYNLLVTRLGLGEVDACVSLIPQIIELAADPNERQLLELLQALLRSCHNPNGSHTLDPLLLDLPAGGEQRLLKIIRGIGQLDVVYTLLRTLLAARPDSPGVQESYFEAGVVKAKGLMDRCAWTAAEQLLAPLAQRKGVARPMQAALFNLLGVCACMCQDFEGGIRHFKAALKLTGADGRVEQNLALAYEWNDDLPQADPHWNRYFDLIDRRLPTPPGDPSYLESLAFEALTRLATCYSDKERWSSALVYLERAHAIRPDDADTVERLFHLYNHAKCPDEARRTLGTLRELRPDDPQLELYEIDLVVPRNLGDVERVVNRIDQVLNANPHDSRVEDRASALLANVIPFMGNLCEQLSGQLGKVTNQVRQLPNYQINWPAVQEVMRDLLRDFQKLRRVTVKCLPLVKHDEHRRMLRELSDLIDRKMDTARSLSRS